MEKWLRDRLSICLDFEIPDDMIKYILSLKNSEEFDEYFNTLLNKDEDHHRLFLADCRQRLFSVALPSKKSNSNQKKSTGHGSTQIKQNVNSQQKSLNSQQGVKKKNKYVNLYSQDGNVLGDVIMLKGRRHCDCQASEHKLINNCLSCGRVVCEQEGSGPCLFCGNIVCTNEEAQILKTTNKKSENLLKSLKEKGGGESLKKALEQRDRLLEYDRNSEKRTTVIDDEMDYFEENSVWLSDAEREKLKSLQNNLQDKKHASRAQRKYKIDFAGHEVPDEPLISEEYERNLLKEIAATNSDFNKANKWSNKSNNAKHTSDVSDIDPNISEFRPVYTDMNDGNAFDKSKLKNEGLDCKYNRVQDKQLLEMQDMRHCLSMHQPYASLLVAGIKKHEGRIWYSEHRGRLWIASTAKEPKEDEIKEVEQFYMNYYNDKTIKFPKQYPTGCLLGCVIVDECLAQEEYRDIYPNGESESAFVFVCTNPQQLPVIFPIKGQHKIYQIDPKLHNAACKTLMRLKSDNTKQ
ncbi:activating signal cointegrator 1 [Teleopsis dalmanni]|uniref:activating signal cointegrator 1 n=1 Tax=Teleopsis dalmanni TaxID=139649 RepID=UPI0018CCFB4E|nr:activating signal cointegrator 1 [Teleopsis dalmanni]